MENTNRLWRAPGFRRNTLLMPVELLWEAEKGECVLIYTALFLRSASLSALSTSLPSDAVRQAYGVYFSDWHLSGFPHSSRESSLAKSICKGLDVAMALWSGSKLFLIFPWQMSVEDNLPPPYKISVSWRETQIQRTAWPCVSFCTSAIRGCAEMPPGDGSPRCPCGCGARGLEGSGAAWVPGEGPPGKPRQRAADRRWHCCRSWWRPKWRRGAKQRICVCCRLWSLNGAWLGSGFNVPGSPPSHLDTQAGHVLGWKWKEKELRPLLGSTSCALFLFFSSFYLLPPSNTLIWWQWHLYQSYQVPGSWLSFWSAISCI